MFSRIADRLKYMVAFDVKVSSQYNDQADVVLYQLNAMVFGLLIRREQMTCLIWELNIILLSTPLPFEFCKRLVSCCFRILQQQFSIP